MSEPETDRRQAGWTRLESVATRLLLGAALLALALVGQHRQAESDVFWHLSQGRAVLRQMARVVPEPTAFPELVQQTKVVAWLWDVTAYLTQQAAGFSGLSWLTSVLALLAGAAVLWMLRGTRPSAPAAAFVLVAGVALASMISRARARPEVAAMLMAPLLIGALQRFTRDPPRGTRYGVLAAAVALLWAQIHGSFLLVLPIAAAVLGPALIRARSERARRMPLLGLALALLAACLTSTSGIDLLAFGSEHAAHDIKLHNQEMHAPLWQTFHPLASTFGPLYLLMAGLGAYGALVCGRGVLAEIGLGLLGAAVATQSVRFLMTASVLTAPLALHGASELVQRARGRRALLALALSCALVSLVLYRALERTQRTIGPLGRPGLAEQQLPLAAAAYLARAPAGTRVLTAYDAGGSLGFFLDGHARTFVDSRTMVLFDSVQFAVARDVFRSPAALERAGRRYRAAATVVPRASTICTQLGPPWLPVAVDPQWTTFSKLDAAHALGSIAPCGREWLLPRACGEGAADLDRDLRRLRELRAAPALVRYLQALRLARCKRDYERAAQRLPARADAPGFLAERDLLAGEIALERKRGAALLDAVGERAAQGDLAAWRVLTRALGRGEVSAAQLLPRARAAVALFDDNAPPELRGLLAALCIEAGDAECAHFHGLRAALAGSPNAAELLRWLAARHPDPRVRQDARAWLAAQQSP